jgi:hypothetical protein
MGQLRARQRWSLWGCARSGPLLHVALRLLAAQQVEACAALPPTTRLSTSSRWLLCSATTPLVAIVSASPPIDAIPEMLASIGGEAELIGTYGMAEEQEVLPSSSAYLMTLRFQLPHVAVSATPAPRNMRKIHPDR